MQEALDVSIAQLQWKMSLGTTQSVLLSRQLLANNGSSAYPGRADPMATTYPTKINKRYLNTRRAHITPPLRRR